MPNQGTFSRDGEVLYLKLGNSYTDAYICQNCLVYIKTYTFGGLPLQYSCLKNPTDRDAWQAPVQRVAKSLIRHSTHTHVHMHTYIHFTVCKLLCFFFSFIFNWRIIALQCCAGFCHTTTSISHKYSHVSSLLNLHPTPLGCHRVPSCTQFLN